MTGVATESAAKRAKAVFGGYEGCSVAAKSWMHYSKVIPGKRVGRYIDVEDQGELADVHEEHLCEIGNAREIRPEPTLDTMCFELKVFPTKVQNFKDNDEIRNVYYAEMVDLMKATTGAEKVIVFDHTVRDTGSGTSLNVSVSEAAAAVLRVHTDYSDNSGPKRVQTLAQFGGYTGVTLSEQDKADILGREFFIANVWRSIKDNEPVQSMPLAVLDPSGLESADFITYEMQYKERKGENYGLKFSPAHRWFFFPEMIKDECLLFKTWESRTDRPRYCFHTAFKDMAQLENAPPRMSIEVRTVCILPRKSAL